MANDPLIIFDCDGVLVDSVAIEISTVIAMAAELGVDINNTEDIAQFQGGRITNAVAFIEQRLGKAVPDNFIDEFRRRSYVAYDENLQAIPGVAEMLEQVTMPFCVASSGPVEKIRRNLNTVGLLPKFEGHIFSCYDINRWKPEPDIFLYAANEMGAKPEQCIVIEDSVLGVRAGVAAGMTVLGFAGTEAADRLAQEGATVFHSMVQLPALLEKIMQNNETKIVIKPATLADAETILKIQKHAYMEEAIFYNYFNIPPLTQTLEETIEEFKAQTVLKATLNGKIIGSVRGYLEDGTCYVGKMMVDPEIQNRGIGSQLLQAIEQMFPEARRFELFTGFKSQRNLHLYQKSGYTIFKTVPVSDDISLSFLEKVGPNVS